MVPHAHPSWALTGIVCGGIIVRAARTAFACGQAAPVRFD
ncbi:hypothetical protein RESH_00249 [Rhodopirellula europaea SH398]|uniref:Uncharacterized protein n=1 Tax=Rhodopirellula europaea SH398 TaxID=1263868 RepID=M5SCB7_9BACT|nr:hypothetical protein RESH_00249 [Rhodopirellula europaea SH398]